MCRSKVRHIVPGPSFTFSDLLFLAFFSGASSSAFLWLADLGDAFFCSTEVPPEESAVSNLDLRGFYLMMTGVLLDSPVADIRDFFPSGLQNSRKEV